MRCGSSGVRVTTAAPRAHRQRERERAPRAEPAVDRHAAALQLDELLHQRQAEARAAELAARGAVDLAELVEDQRVMRGSMPMPSSRTDTVIAPPSSDARIVIGESGGENFTAFESRLKRICLNFARSVSICGRSAATSMTIFGVCAGHAAHDLADAVDDRPDGEGLRIDLHLPGLDLREVEDVVDDAEQVLAGGEDVRRKPRCFGSMRVRPGARRGSRRSR